MMLTYLKTHLFKILFFTIGVLYILLYLPFGFEGTDTGYIFGTSWNIYNGQLPHRDFIYTRPAIPAYLHTIFIFISETYGYLLERAFFYIQIFTYSYLGTKLIFDLFKIESRQQRYFVATLAAIVSIHNYPPMGWNTIDGVFFCVIGIYLITKKSTSLLPLIFGSLSIVLGTFSKQSFYFVPIFLFLYLIFIKDYKTLKQYVILGILWVLAYVGLKHFTGSLLPFIDQTFIRTPTSGLVKSGIKAYYLALKLNFGYVFALGVLLWASYRLIPKKYAYLVFNLLICGFLLNVFLSDENAWTIIEVVFQLWFIGTGIYFLIKARKDTRYYLALLLLTVSWSASISNGYRTPIHFSLPFILGLFFFFDMHKKQYNSYIAATVLGVYLITFFVGYQTIYRDSERPQLAYDLGEVFEQLHFIKSDKDTYNELKELKALAKEYNNFTVLPSSTQAHYLTKTVNPIGIDWPLDVEINDTAVLLEQQLATQRVTVFMEKKKLTPQQLAGYTLKSLVEKNWKLVRETEHFKIYQY